tara:strand:+ start:2680 stop:3834 length:1155 start_codon:yes stop_codon:yes gene_type:complete
MKRFLFITHFFEPEIGAASSRITQLARELSFEHKITVLTSWPNFFQKKSFKIFEKKENITIIRLPILKILSKNIFLRLLSMINFSIYLIILSPLIFLKNFNYIYVQGHPLISAFFGVLIGKITRRKIILNVSDIWPRTGLDLNVFKEGLLYSLLLKIEKFNYMNSHLIITQSNQTKKYIENNFKISSDIIVFYNVPKKVSNNFNINERSRFKILYAGLLGHAQGIYELCQNIELSENNYELHIYGNGAETSKIKNYISGNSSIHLHDFINNDKLNSKMKDFDFGIVRLNNNIFGALPSKIFYYSSNGLPIIYMGGGEAKTIIDKYKFGWTFESSDFKQLNEHLRDRKINKDDLKEFRKSLFKNYKANFSFIKQFNNFKRELFKS